MIWVRNYLTPLSSDEIVQFEIAKTVADRFLAAVKAAPEEPIRIEPAGAPGVRKERPDDRKPTQGSRPPKSFKPKPKGKKSNDGRR